VKAIARLMLVYFVGTPLRRGLSLLGAAATVIGIAALLYLPPLVAQWGQQSQFSLAVEAFLTLLPLIGVTLLLFGGSLMPAAVSHFASSHYAYVLPHGRIKLLASALVMVVLLAAISSGASIAYYINTGMPFETLTSRMWVATFLTYTLVYLVLWLVGQSQSALAVIGASLLVVPALLMPLRLMNPLIPLRWAAIPAIALWIAIAAALLFASRMKVLAARTRRALRRREAAAFAAQYEGGNEIDLMVGTSRPWVLALGQVVPIVVATYFIGRMYGDVAIDTKTKVWLFYLTIFSVLSGGSASFAAARSRALWLRARWMRPELFLRVEAAFWKHNGYALGILLVTMAAVGSVFDLPIRPLAFGLALLALGTTVSTYLGLTLTRSIGWLQASVAVGSMLLLLTTAIYATDREVAAGTIATLEAALAALALVLRHVAKRRWLALDWMECRPEAAARGAS
jgi:hypothetical protein